MLTNYRFTDCDDDDDENKAEIVVPCTPEDHALAAQCDRFYLVTPEDDNTSELPPSLRKFGEQMVAVLKSIST